MIAALRVAGRRRLLGVPLALLVAFAALLITAASVLAYLRASGLGSGSASVGSAQAVTVQAVASGTPASVLVPGGSADLLIQISNPNDFNVTLTGVAQNGALSVVGGTSCTVSTSKVSVPTQAALSITVAPGTHVVHVPSGVSMAIPSASGCQGASFDIPVTVTVHIP